VEEVEEAMDSKSIWIGVGAALGAGLGAALGVATHQMGAWLPIGTGVGLAIGSALGQRKDVARESDRPKAKISSARG
jgi:hypothetical protein